MGPKVVFEPILILNEVTEFKDNPDNPIVYVKVCTYTVLPAKSDSDFMFCLQNYHGLRIDRSLVY